MLFFLATAQRQHPHQGITKDSVNRARSKKSGKSIGFPKLTSTRQFRHHSSVTGLRARPNPCFTRQQGLESTFPSKTHPLDYRKRQENRADLSAAEKVQVLRNSLASRNNIGAFDAKGKLHHQVVDYNNRTFDAAYEFFLANPDFTVADLNVVLGKCLTLPKEPDNQEGNDPLWHARRGKDISFLIQHLDIIVKSLDCVDEVAPFQPVPGDQLFKKSKSAAKPQTE
jgi:hypothetical protein